MTNRTEEELLKAVPTDDSAAEELIERYKALVLKETEALYLVGGERDDLIQEGTIGLYYAITHYDASKGGFFGFAQRCIRSGLLKAIEKANAQKNSPLNDSISYDTPEGEFMMEGNEFAESPEFSMLRQEEYMGMVQKMQSCLSETEFKVVLMHLQGFELEDIARALNISKKQADNARTRAKKKLSKEDTI